MRGAGTRFIPAGAGNTESRPAFYRVSAVYPRWRGEHVHTQTITESQNGLSPLARGTPVLLFCAVVTDRFIPAGAGNTPSAAAPHRYRAVYPRWRGEHSRKTKRPPASRGLSPLARGTHGLLSVSPPERRFIPAGAGNTLNITYY